MPRKRESSDQPHVDRCGDCKVLDGESFCYVMQETRAGGQESCCMFNARRVNVNKEA